MTKSLERVELVARAMCVANHKDPDEVVTRAPCAMLRWQAYSDTARAAIAALESQPTEGPSEREQIAAWLRREADRVDGLAWPDMGPGIVRRMQALCIERGDHLGTSPIKLPTDWDDEAGLVLILFNALHEGFVDNWKPVVAMSDLSDKQAEQGRAAVQAIRATLGTSKLPTEMVRAGLLNDVKFLRSAIVRDADIEWSMVRAGLLREILDVAETALASLDGKVR